MSERPDAIRDFLAGCVERGRMPGAAWWVEDRDGRASHGAVGWAVLEPERVALEEATPFDLASLTKPLCTALLLVLLEREGSLDPRLSAGALLAELEGTPCGRPSLLDLASHRGGLAAWRPLYLGGPGTASYLARLAREVPAVSPGETLYSDLGYIVLGLALERASGRGLERLFADRVARPLGSPRIGFARGDFADAAATERGNAYERRLCGAEGRGHPWRATVLRGEVHDANAWGLGGAAGHAGLFGTVAAVAALVREILRPQRLALDARARGRLLGPPEAGGDRSVGMVLARGAAAARGVLPGAAPGHTGFTGTSLWLDPPRGAFAVLLTNRVHPVVGPRPFDPLRRGFHRLATRALGGAAAAGTLQ